MDIPRLKTAIMVYGLKKDKSLHLLSSHVLSLGQSPDILLQALLRDVKVNIDLFYEKILFKLERIYIMDN